MAAGPDATAYHSFVGSSRSSAVGFLRGWSCSLALPVHFLVFDVEQLSVVQQLPDMIARDKAAAACNARLLPKFSEIQTIWLLAALW